MARDRSELLMAYRWPVALVSACVVLAGTALVITQAAIRVLREPIPIRIQGGLDVDRLVMPSSVTIRADQPLPVAGVVDVADAVQITGNAPLGIKGPITVREIKLPVKVAGDVSARATVSAIEAPVAVTSGKPLDVKGDVTVKGDIDIDGEVDIKGKVGAEVRPKLLPLP